MNEGLMATCCGDPRFGAVLFGLCVVVFLLGWLGHCLEQRIVGN